jgi:hypothetical protein
MIATIPDLDTAPGLLAALLQGTVQTLDIPAELAALARARYREVGALLNVYGDHGSRAPWDVYPQGSVLLGTVVLPLRRNEFDIDLVCVRLIEPTSITQLKLKSDVGAALEIYVRKMGHVVLREGSRCWILEYGATPFHLDVLPALPDPDGSASGILLTDRGLSRWLSSDPKGYAAWFSGRMAQELLRKRAALAEQRQSTLEDVPDWEVKTTLQQTAQVLKRHRDIFFKNDPDSRPPSILVTTLAGLSYGGERNLFEAVVGAADMMTAHVEKEGVRWVVANPVQEKENFADKWVEHPERASRFFAWVEVLKRDLSEAHDMRGQGIDQVAQRLSRSFGEEPVMKSAEKVAAIYKGAREAGRLGMAVGSGILSTTAGGRQVRPHTFYGDDE